MLTRAVYVCLNNSREWITAENIVELLRKHSVPVDLDLLSVDIDFNDYWVLKAILKAGHFKPRVIAVEVNANLGPTVAKTVQYAPTRSWDGKSDYYGASVAAMHKLGAAHGYSMVYCESHGVNCFMVRADVLQEVARAEAGVVAGPQARQVEAYVEALVANQLTPEKLHRAPNYLWMGTQGYKHDSEGEWVHV